MPDHGCLGWVHGQRPAASISLCMIVRDEEQLLGRCLLSIAGLVDELIVVDTGSTDSTVAIAERHGAQVYRFAWAGDFAAARNAALEKATCEWVLVLDADEVLTAEFCAHAGERVRQPGILAYECLLEDHQDREVVRGPLLRLFRNLAGVQYRRAYHERVCFPESFGQVGSRIVFAPELVIFHDGNRTERVRERRKPQRAIETMQQALAADPGDAYLKSKLAGAYLQANQPKEALHWAEQACQSCESGRVDPAVRCEILTTWATALALDEQRAAAESALEAVLQLPADDVHKGNAATLLAQLYAARQERAGVYRLWDRFGKQLPGSWSLQLALASALRSEGRRQEAIAVLNRLAEQFPASGEARMHLATTLAEAGQLEAALAAIEKALTLAGGHSELLRQGEALRDQIDTRRRQSAWETFYAAGGEDELLSQCFERIGTFLLGRRLSLLELGCGSGGLALSVAGVVEQYLGLDWSPTAVERVQAWGLEAQVANVETGLPVANGSYDAVALCRLLEHCRAPEQVLAEAWRVLRPQGWLIMALAQQPAAGDAEPITPISAEHLEGWLASLGAQCWITGVSETDDLPMLLAFAQKQPAPMIPPLQKQTRMTSIVMLTLNQLDYTRRCLESLWLHTPQPFELIVVDNGSSDGTQSFLEALQAERPEQVRLICNERNLGFAAGNNQGLAIARGEQLLLLNNDTVVTSGWLANLTVLLQSQSQLGIVGPVSNYVAGAQLIANPLYDEQSLADLDTFADLLHRRFRGQALAANRVIGFCMLIDRAVVERIGGLDPGFGTGNLEDDDYCLRTRIAGYTIAIARDVFIHHFGNRTFIGERIDYSATIQRNWQYFCRKWGLDPDASPERGIDSTAIVLSNTFCQQRDYTPLKLPQSHRSYS